jgi:ABC-type amino acid transport system permease subunit
VLFRGILAIPHMILVGGAGISLNLAMDGTLPKLGSEGGLLGAVAGFLAIISWFTIVIAGAHIIGIRQFCMFVMRWRVRALAYLMLLEDAYPPFGDAPYPANIDIADPPLPRDRLTVAVRIILGIPHFIVLFFLIFGWTLATIAAWFVILITGEYPAGLYDFSVGTFRWMMRVEAYMLLLVDEYPPFSLE